MHVRSAAAVGSASPGFNSLSTPTPKGFGVILPLNCAQSSSNPSGSCRIRAIRGQNEFHSGTLACLYAICCLTQAVFCSSYSTCENNCRFRKGLHATGFMEDWPGRHVLSRDRAADSAQRNAGRCSGGSGVSAEAVPARI